jgi:hypothetical protein
MPHIVIQIAPGGKMEGRKGVIEYVCEGGFGGFGNGLRPVEDRVSRYRRDLSFVVIFYTILLERDTREDR